MEGLVDSKIRLHGGYSDWGRAAEPSDKRAPYDRLGTGTHLIIISLLSLGLWAGIWVAVGFLASAALG